MAPLTLLLALSNVSFAYSYKTTDDGTELYWASSPIEVQLNAGGMEDMTEQEARGALQAAVNDFNRSDASDLEFNLESQRGPEVLSWEDDANVVYFTDDWGALGHDDSLLAMTYTWFLDSGEIIGFDLVVNVANHEWDHDGDPNANDLHNTLTHELGHAAGLGHSEVPEASMYSTTFPGELQKRVLHEDDEEALANLYGTGSFESELPFACSSAGRGLGGSLPFGVFGLVMAGLMRRRRDSDPQGVR